MFKAIADMHPRDQDLPSRTHALTVLKAALDGTLYDVMPFQWHQETDGAQKYIPVAQRAPCVRYSLCRMAVEDSVSLLFGDNHFPAIQCEDVPTVDALKAITREAHLDLLMTDAAMRGSVGSIAMHVRILKQRVFVDAYDTMFLTPSFDPEAPDTLVGMREAYKVKGRDLKAQGYSITEDKFGADFWFQREWDDQDETWFLPLLVTDAKEGKPPAKDTAKSVHHALGFCPWIWIRNLPGGTAIDGFCTFRPAIETQIDIEYQLSLGSRALKYSAAPTLMIKQPSASGAVHLAAGDSIIVDKDGDAKWLEINGDAAKAVIEYVRLLRETALESIHGNRSNADKVSAAQSGRALELLHQPLIWLADKLRLTYGECGLLPLYRMIVRASQKYPVRVAGKPVKMLADAELTLAWPDWFPATASDRSSDAGTLKTLTQGGLMSQATAVKQLLPVYDIASEQDEISAIAADQALADKRAASQAAAIAATETVAASA